MRESSRIVIIPMEEPHVGMLSTDFDRLMDQTSRSIHQFVGVARRIKEQGPTRFMDLTNQLLPQMDRVGDRIAKNYALNLYFAELVNLFIHICYIESIFN